MTGRFRFHLIDLSFLSGIVALIGGLLRTWRSIFCLLGIPALLAFRTGSRSLRFGPIGSECGRLSSPLIDLLDDPGEIPREQIARSLECMSGEPQGADRRAWEV